MKKLVLTTDQRTDWLALAIAIAAGVALIVVNLAAHPLAVPLSAESDKYFITADNLLHGGEYDDRFRPPAYTVIVAVLSFISTQNTFLVGKIVASVSAAIMIWLSYLLAQVFLNRKFALWLEILVAIDSLVVLHGLLASTDTLYSAICLSALVLMTRWQKTLLSRESGAALIGVAIGMAFLTRYTALFLIPCAILTFMSADLSHRAKWYYMIVSLVTAFVVNLPWLVYSTVHLGAPFANDNWRNFALAVFGQGKWDQFGSSSAELTGYLDVITRAPGLVLQTWGKNLLDTMKALPTYHCSSLVVAVFVPIGGIVCWRNRAGRILLLYVLSAVATIVLGFMYIDRLLMPITPVMILLGLIGVVSLVGRLSNAKVTKAVVIATVLAISLLSPWSQLAWRFEIFQAAQPISEIELLNQVLLQARSYPVRIVSLYQFADRFVAQPDRLVYSYLPSWYSSDYYRSDTFRQLLLETASQIHADYILVSDRLTQNAVQTGQIAAMLTDCWQLDREVTASSGQIQLFRRSCEW